MNLGMIQASSGKPDLLGCYFSVASIVSITTRLTIARQYFMKIGMCRISSKSGEEFRKYDQNLIYDRK